MSRLRIPAAIAFTVMAGTATVAGVFAGCERGSSPTDGSVTDGTLFPDGGCAVFCIPDPTSDAGVCPEPAPCGDEMGACPAGCRPVG